jgi:tetratricopeptide (TPR) repeat protein
MTRTTRFVLACLMIGLGWGIGSGVTLLLHQLPVFPTPAPVLRVEPAKPPSAAADPLAVPPELELRYQILRNQLDNAAENSKQLDRLATLLLTLTSLYALALGLNSFFGLQQILDSGKEDLGKLRDFLSESRSAVRDKLAEVDTKVGDAVANANSQLSDFRDSGKEDLGKLRDFLSDSRNAVRDKLAEVDTKVGDALARANSQLSDFRKELREKYPELANLHANLRDILAEIRLMFPTGRDWIKQYDGLTSEQREKFGVAEMRIIGLEVFGLGDVDPLRQDVRQVYQGLGRFYSSRYRNEKQRSYWERASLYFETAVRLDPEPPPELLKDLGVHLTLIEQILDVRVATPGAAKATPEELREVEALRARAERAFRESLSRNPLEPGALFGLAWLLYKKPDYQDAIAQYAVVTTITAWAAGDRQKFLEDAYLNQACCYSLMAAPDPIDAAWRTALGCLKESKKVAIEYGRLPDWKAKIEKEAASEDLRKLKSVCLQEFEAIVA